MSDTPREKPTAPHATKLTLGARGNELVLCMILDPPTNPSRILLGFKKRGHGEGFWNGFGGHPESGETMEQATLREIEEECSLKVSAIEKRGTITFHMDSDTSPTFVHVYTARAWSGSPVESEEMLPKWFPIGAIPYEKMWADDIKWLPCVIAEKNFEAAFWFDKQDKMRKGSVKELPRDVKP